MADYKKTQLTLPPEVTAAFESLGDDLEARNAYIGALRAAGWTLQSISEATGVTRERVRQISKGDARTTTLPVPEPPLKITKAPRTFVEPDPAKLARLLELQPEAQQNRHHSDEKQRRAAEEYTALLWDVHNQDGVTLYRLSKRLGVTHGALRFRLARYGYKLPQDGGTSKVYTRIDPANRVTI